MRDVPSAFGVIRQKIDDNHYSVLVAGIPVECTYYRTAQGSGLGVGDPVFIEKIDGSQLWMISSHAPSSPSSVGNNTWLQFDHDVFGKFGGPGRFV